MATISPKFALVTAGSAGLGAAIARTLAVDCGMSVVINYAHNAARATSLVETLQKEVAEKPGSSQQTFHTVAADLQRPGDVKQLVADTLALTGGKLDAVISNVGWTRMTDFFDLEQGVVEEDWDRCFDVNVKGHMRLFHAVRSALDKAEDGVFISTASVAGVKPSGSSLPYAVTKAALIHLVKSLAIIAAPGVRVNSVSPGIMLTDWGKSFPQEKLDKAKDASKLKRFATVDDVARQVRVFVESSTITGQNAVIDAGFSL
ncbi:hypothetical protein SBRCBS47491_008734 [Sporothrix bragantina]|uniref:Granaticin polyketide synthase ketoacyl reductase 2 n=1 Tax=Sporothrix bragantina TaxID=671064 RepID=A0ABP0CNZ0_9PEZI